MELSSQQEKTPNKFNWCPFKRNNDADVAHLAYEMCHDHNLYRPDRGTFIRETGQWIFSTHRLQHDDIPAKLELFRVTEDSRISHYKSLNVKGVMACSASRRYPKYVAFVYDYLGSVPQYVALKQLDIGRPRETVVVSFLRDIVAGLKELHKLRLYHSALCWDVIDVNLKGRANVSALEYLIDIKETSETDLSLVRHLPPESLNRVWGKRLDVEKIEGWILGSMLLELVLNKNISGKNFECIDSEQKRREAFINILTNVPKLEKLFRYSNLSTKTQRLIKSMLSVDPKVRPNLARIWAALYRPAPKNELNEETSEEEETKDVERKPGEAFKSRPMVNKTLSGLFHLSTNHC